jgi:hypothetical protein
MHYHDVEFPRQRYLLDNSSEEGSRESQILCFSIANGPLQTSALSAKSDRTAGRES